MLELAAPWLAEEDPWAVPDGSFSPNLLNSLIFLLSTWMQLNTFAVNYSGAPFTKPLREHTPLWIALRVGWLLVLVAASGLLPPLGRLLELTPLPGALRPASHMTANDSGLLGGGLGSGGSSGWVNGAWSGAGGGGGGSIVFRVALMAVLGANAVAVYLVELAARSLAR